MQKKVLEKSCGSRRYKVDWANDEIEQPISIILETIDKNNDDEIELKEFNDWFKNNHPTEDKNAQLQKAMKHRLRETGKKWMCLVISLVVIILGFAAYHFDTVVGQNSHSQKLAFVTFTVGFLIPACVGYILDFHAKLVERKNEMYLMDKLKVSVGFFQMLFEAKDTFRECCRSANHCNRRCRSSESNLHRCDLQV